MRIPKMPAATLTTTILMAATTLLTAGCDDKDERLARQAAESMQRQAEQNKQMADLQKEVAQGAHKLVEADAEARAEFVAMQGELQQQQAETGRQRDRSLAIWTGTFLRPSFLAAFQRVWPTTITPPPSTTIGWRKPYSLSDAATASTAASL